VRGMVEGLTSPVPVGTRLPAVLQEDDLLQRFTGAFDDALAPVYLTLDALACYVDPQLAPADFLEWLCGWVGIEPDETWTTERRREIVAHAAAVHRWRGTPRGVAEAVRLVVEGDVQVRDNGGSSWSAAPAGRLPGAAEPALHVRVVARGPVDRPRVERVIGAVSAAHVPFTLEIAEEAP
jgi:phage tail-like protein